METTFASRIRQYRQEKGLSQQALAELCGLTQGNIAHMENGTEPKQSNVSKLVAGLPDLNPDWLLTGDGPMLRGGRSLSPIEAPATKAAPVVQAPVANAPDPELLKEIRDSRELAWRLAEKEQRNAEYWRALYMAEVRRYMHVDEPHEDSPESPAATAAPGKDEVDSFAAEINPSTGCRYISLPYRTDGNVDLRGGVLASQQECVIRQLTPAPFILPGVSLVIDETPEEELDEYALVKTA